MYNYDRIFKRYVGVFTGTQKMVAGPDYYRHAVTWCIADLWWQFGCCSIYLFIVLNEVAGETYLFANNSCRLWLFVLYFSQGMALGTNQYFACGVSYRSAGTADSPWMDDAG